MKLHNIINADKVRPTIITNFCCVYEENENGQLINSSIAHEKNCYNSINTTNINYYKLKHYYFNSYINYKSLVHTFQIARRKYWCKIKYFFYRTSSNTYYLKPIEELKENSNYRKYKICCFGVQYEFGMSENGASFISPTKLIEYEFNPIPSKSTIVFYPPNTLIPKSQIEKYDSLKVGDVIMSNNKHIYTVYDIKTKSESLIINKSSATEKTIYVLTQNGNRQILTVSKEFEIIR